MDNKNFETEEEMKDRLRKEILDELNGTTTTKKMEGEVRTYQRPQKTSSKVNFSKTKNVTYEEKVKVQEEKINEKNNNVLLVVCLLVTVILVALFPTISKTVAKAKNSQRKPSVKVEKEPEKVYEKLTLNSEEIKNISYPVMHVDNSKKNTYFSLDTLVVSDFSNNDLLYNALIDVGTEIMKKYVGTYNGNYCGIDSNRVYISERNIKLRIDNKFNTNTKFEYKDIIVPNNNPKTDMIGIWKHDAENKIYVYYGACNVSKSNVLYFDVSVPYEVDNSDKNIEAYVYSYVAFAVVNTNNNQYILYSDADYTKEINRGTLNSNNYEKELKTIVSNMDKNNINKYKYSFSKKNCSYSEYCFIKGEWTK